MKCYPIHLTALALFTTVSMTGCDRDKGEDYKPNPTPRPTTETTPGNVPAGGQAAGSTSGGSTTGPTSGGQGIPDRQPAPGSGP